MLMYLIWTELAPNCFYYPLYRVFGCLIISIFAIPIDLILSPLEILAYIIYKFLNKEG
jgi:hypothetical protein